LKATHAACSTALVQCSTRTASPASGWSHRRRHRPPRRRRARAPGSTRRDHAVVHQQPGLVQPARGRDRSDPDDHGGRLDLPPVGQGHHKISRLPGDVLSTDAKTGLYTVPPVHLPHQLSDLGSEQPADRRGQRVDDGDRVPRSTGGGRDLGANETAADDDDCARTLEIGPKGAAVVEGAQHVPRPRRLATARPGGGAGRRSRRGRSRPGDRLRAEPPARRRRGAAPGTCPNLSSMPAARAAASVSSRYPIRGPMFRAARNCLDSGGLS